MKRFTNLFLALVVILFLLFLGEAVLRYRSQDVSERVFYQVDSLLGWSLRPGVEAEYKTEGASRVRINSQGFRDKERTIEKPDGVFRVAVLGDSFVEAMQVEQEESFSSLLESALWRCPSLKGLVPEVLNFGVKGYGTAQELLLYRQRARLYSPNAVVLMVFPGNDIYNNSPSLNPTNAELAPYFEIDPVEGLVLRASFSGDDREYQAWRFWLRKVPAEISRHSVFLRSLINPLLKLLPCKYCEAQAVLREKYGAGYHDYLVWMPPEDATMMDAWRITESLLLEFFKQVHHDGAKFLLAITSNSIQVHPSASLQRDFLRRFSLSSLNYASNRLEDFATKHGIPSLSLVDPLRKEAQSLAAPVHGFPNLTPGFGHWNQAGHRVVAEVLAEKLCREIS